MCTSNTEQIEQTCSSQTDLLNNTIQKVKILEERVALLEKIIDNSYPSPLELKTFLEVSQDTWAEIFAKSKDYYRCEFLEWACVSSAKKWEDCNFPTAKQVHFGLRLVAEHTQENPLLASSPQGLYKRVSAFILRRS